MRLPELDIEPGDRVNELRHLGQPPHPRFHYVLHLGLPQPDDRTSQLGVTGSYEYRADGMRIHKVVGAVNTEYYHDGQMPMEDAVISGTTLTATRYGLGARGIDYEEEGVGTWTNTLTRTPGAFSNVGFPIYDAHGPDSATLHFPSAGSSTT